jgi:replication-associated recombination protein RarA
MPVDAAQDPWTRVHTRHGYQADEVISALQKEIRRGHSENAALLAYEMLTSSPDLEAMLWKRLKIISVEDIGWGELQAPVLIQALDRMRSDYGPASVERSLLAIHATRYLASLPKDRSSDEMAQWIRGQVEQGELRPSIPDYALDVHTARGQQMGRGRRHFFEQAAALEPELPDRDPTYRDRLLQLLEDEG